MSGVRLPKVTPASVILTPPYVYNCISNYCHYNVIKKKICDHFVKYVITLFSLQTPHAHYEPSSENKVPCKDPLCQSLHPPGEHRCETPEQCDYELQYLDGLLSYGVLVKDVFSFNSISGEQFIPSLALGLVTLLASLIFNFLNCFESNLRLALLAFL